MSGFTLLWKRDIFSSDPESHIGNDRHVLASSWMEMQCVGQGHPESENADGLGPAAGMLAPPSQRLFSSVTLGPVHPYRPHVLLTACRLLPALIVPTSIKGLEPDQGETPWATAVSEPLSGSVHVPLSQQQR